MPATLHEAKCRLHTGQTRLSGNTFLRVNPRFQLADVPPQILSFSRVPAVTRGAVQMLMAIYRVKALLDQRIPRLTDRRIPFTL